MGRRVGRVLLAAMIATAVTVVAMPGTAGADTCCTDGWLSPSEGGSGTCSHHGGIAGADYSYSPNDVTRKHVTRHWRRNRSRRRSRATASTGLAVGPWSPLYSASSDSSRWWGGSPASRAWRAATRRRAALARTCTLRTRRPAPHAMVVIERQAERELEAVDPQPQEPTGTAACLSLPRCPNQLPSG
jgi:hypothetical protein